VIDQRSAAAFGIGVAGLVCGIAGAVAGSGLLAVIAGIAALVAGVGALQAAAQARVVQARAVAVEDELRATRELVPPEPEPAAEVPAGDDPLTDADTGLFTEQYFRVTLDTRISAARRHLRPVALVLVDVVEDLQQGNPHPADASVVAEGIRQTLREADTACRLSDGTFALVLEDTPENGAVWTVERVRRGLAIEHPNQTMWAGVACYPAHAFDADEIVERAVQALHAAREWHQDRIEVATAEG
jgi:two-component system cell cycle response regulator